MRLSTGLYLWDLIAGQTQIWQEHIYVTRMRIRHTTALNIKVNHTSLELDLWVLFRILSVSEYHTCLWLNIHVKPGLLIEDAKDVENIFNIKNMRIHHSLTTIVLQRINQSLIQWWPWASPFTSRPPLQTDKLLSETPSHHNTTQVIPGEHLLLYPTSDRRGRRYELQSALVLSLVHWFNSQTVSELTDQTVQLEDGRGSTHLGDGTITQSTRTRLTSSALVRDEASWHPSTTPLPLPTLGSLITPQA